jgi:hypothetical protein
MRVKCWVCLILLGVVALTPLAYASPPDPSWIRGLYDGGDFDDVVVLLTSGTGIVEPFPLHAVCPRLVAAGSALPAADGSAPSSFPSFKPARGPPSR